MTAIGPRLPLKDAVRALGGELRGELGGDPQVPLDVVRDLLAAREPWGGVSPWDDDTPANVEWIRVRRRRCVR